MLDEAERSSIVRHAQARVSDGGVQLDRHEIEFDDEAFVSLSHGGGGAFSGAWVQAWVWFDAYTLGMDPERQES